MVVCIVTDFVRRFKVDFVFAPTLAPPFLLLRAFLDLEQKTKDKPFKVQVWVILFADAVHKVALAEPVADIAILEWITYNTVRSM